MQLGLYTRPLEHRKKMEFVHIYSFFGLFATTSEFAESQLSEPVKQVVLINIYRYQYLHDLRVYCSILC